MSLEVLDEPSKQGRALTLDIPGDKSDPPSSAASSEPPSPNPLADSDRLSPQATTSEIRTSASSTTSGYTTASTSSLPAPKVSVKFAPLPELAPRRRRSTVPLGMAARAQLVRKRKAYHTDQQQQQRSASPDTVIMSPEEFEQERLRQEAIAAQYAQFQGSAHALAARETEAEQAEEEFHGAERARGTDEIEDPFLALGKVVKGVSRTFWRRVSHKDADAAGVGAAALTKEGGKEADKEGRKGKEESRRRRKSDVGRDREPPRSTPTPPVPPLPAAPAPPLRPILATITPNVEEYPEVVTKSEEGGGVWEEEIGDDIPLNVGQTQTIIEGRPVYSSTVEVVAKASTTTTTTTTTKADAKASPVVLRAPNSKTSLVRGRGLVNVKS
ncbi:hypothetical protein BDZ97DRAFT_206001 [Flammula alnicola]|nr:hypothetical protein BDZ97DRAFT_206001 [Flammula alnicola]